MNAKWIVPPFLALFFVVSWSRSDRDSTTKLALMRLEQHCQGMTPEVLNTALDEIDGSATARKLSSGD